MTPPWRWRPRRPPATIRATPRRPPTNSPGWWGVTSRNSEAKALLSAAVARERARGVFEVALAGGLGPWGGGVVRVDGGGAFPAGVSRARYRDLRVPSH